jgi:tRNA(Leu) C34 or U34 (ribose-2'-O)-methylase TrmL
MILDFDSGSSVKTDEEIKEFLSNNYGLEKPANLQYYAKERRDDILTAISDLRAKGYKIYALEQGIERPALNILDVKNYPNQVALILGEEVHGIPKEILAACDELIEIPMRGQKESFNVSVAAGIAIWEISKASQNGKEMYLRTQKESQQPE